MIQLAIRLQPTRGEQDLAWMRRTVDDLHDIYQFLLDAQITDAIEGSSMRALSPEEHAAAVTGQAAQVGTPLVRVRDGSLVLELAQFIDQTTGTQALLALGLLLKKGPDVVAWPGRLRQAWYSSQEQALQAREKYQRLRSEATIELVGDRPDDSADEPAAANTGAAQRTRVKKVSPPVRQS